MALTLSMTRGALAGGEADLVAAARDGHDPAFEQLYSLYRDRICAFIAGRVRDHGRAEDITQDVFISAHRRLCSSDRPIAFRPWIYEIAKNACIDEFRRGARLREVPLQTDGDPVADQHAILSALPTPPAAIESKQRLDDLRGAFGGLSENHHRLLVMREFEGMSYDEIGDRLGMTRQMVESGLFRARRKLSAEYDELASGRRCDQVQSVIETGTARSTASLGIRERRRFARHLAHCQPCRQRARLAGVDEALIKPRSVAAKIAALLPFPLWCRPSRGGRGHGGETAGRASSGSHHMAAVGSIQKAASLAEPAGSSVTLGSAAAAAAAAAAMLAIAGAGGGLIHGAGRNTHPRRPVARPTHAGSALPARSPARAGVGPAGVAAPSAGHAVRSVTGAHSRVTITRHSPRSRRHHGAPSAPGSAGAPGSTTPGPATTVGSASTPARPTVAGVGTVALAAAPVKLPAIAGGVRSTVTSPVHTVAGTVHTVAGATHTVAGATHPVLSSSPASGAASGAPGVTVPPVPAGGGPTPAPGAPSVPGTVLAVTRPVKSAVSTVTSPLSP